MDEHYCLYGLTWSNRVIDGLGAGVDPRFPVELVPYGRLAALASRVGLDEFDLSKLQEGSSDLPWLTQVAVRHNEIVAAAARQLPVLPMRLGILFASRSSLIAKLGPCEAVAAEFLRRLEDRQEWAVKVYLDQNRAEEVIAAGPPSPKRRGPLAAYLPARSYGRVDPPHAMPDASRPREDAIRSDPRKAADSQPPGQTVPRGGGTQYLVARGQHVERRRQVEASAQQAAATVEARLKNLADSWLRLRPLPHVFTERSEKMIWNAAFLLAKSAMGPFQSACEQLQKEWAPRGLTVEVTGPWPPYHFCPSFESHDETPLCHSTC